MTPIAGIVLGASLLIGSTLECQPYSHVAKRALAHYFESHRARILAGASIVAFGAVALYVFVGGIWRVVTAREDPGRARLPESTLGIWSRRAYARCMGMLRRFASSHLSSLREDLGARPGRQAGLILRSLPRLLLVGTGVLWVWMTVLTMTLTDWQALTANRRTDPLKLSSFSHLVDVIANVALVPAIILVVVATARLLARDGALADSLDAFLITVGASVAVLALGSRAITLLWPALGTVNARVAWLGFAVWTCTAGVALRTRVQRPAPI